MAIEQQQKIEIELEIQKTAATAVVQEIAKSISDVVKNVGDMGAATTGTDSGLARTTKSVQQLSEKSKDSTKSLGMLATALAPLVGPIGTIALIGSGLAAVASTLDDFATKKLNFKNLSIDIGLTTGQMSIMGRTFERMGMSADESKSRIQEIGAQLKDLQTYGERTDLFRNLSFRGDGAFAKALLKAVKAGEFYEAFQMINKEYNRIHTVEGPAAANNFLSNVNGMTESIAKFYDERSKGVRESVHTNTAALKEFHQRYEDITNALSNRWSQFVYTVMGFSLAYGNIFMPEKYDPSLGGKLGGFVGRLFDPKPMGPGPAADDPSRSMLKRKGHRFEFEKDDKEEKDSKKETNSTLERIRDSIKGLFGGAPKQHGGSVEAGQNYLVGENRPEVYMGGGDIQFVGVDGPQIIQPSSPGMISASGNFPQFMPNIHAPQIEMPSFENRFGDWNAKSFEGRFGDWNKSSVEDRFGDWTTQGGGTRPSGSFDFRGGGVNPSAGPDMSSFDRRQLDVTLNAETGAAPNLNAEITFKNIPPGVMTKADGDGFDNFKVNKSKALE